MLKIGFSLPKIRDKIRNKRSNRVSRILLKPFLKDEDGTALVEFALIALPFFMMFMAIVELGLLFFATLTLENGLAVASRQIRTGELELSGGGPDEFREVVCEGVDAMLSCAPEDLMVDVRVFDQFSNVNFDDPLADGDLEDDMQFNAGTAEDIVLVRVFYRWQLLTPLIGDYFKTEGQEYRLLNANMAFRSEPYNF